MLKIRTVAVVGCWLGLVALGLPAAAFETPLPAEEAVPEEVYSQAVQAFQLGDPGSAIRLFARAQRESGTTSAACLLGLGRSYMLLRDYPNAEIQLRAALASDPPPAYVGRAHLLLGRTLLARSGDAADEDELKRAAEEFRAALEADASADSARFHLGETLLKLGRGKRGRRKFADYLQRAPEGPFAARARLLLDRPGCLGRSCLPDLSLKLIDGTTLELAQLRGKVILVDFWATWCSPCVEALPKIQRIAAEMNELPFTILGISADRDRETVATFVEAQKMEWLHYWDERQELARRQFGIMTYPTYVVVDTEGYVEYSAVGWSPEIEQALRDAVERAIEAPKR